MIGIQNMLKLFLGISHIVVLWYTDNFCTALPPSLENT